MELRKYLLNNLKDFTTTATGPKSVSGTVVIYFQNNQIWVVDSNNIKSIHKHFYKRIMCDIPQTVREHVKKYPGFRIFISYERLKEEICGKFPDQVIKKVMPSRKGYGICMKITHVTTGHYYLTRHYNPKVNEISVLRDAVTRWGSLIGVNGDSRLCRFVNTYVHDILKGVNFTIKPIGTFLNEEGCRTLVENTLNEYGTDKLIRNLYNGLID